MQVKQQNIKSFDITIENEVEFFSYFNKNLPLLQSHLMILRGNVSSGVKVYLQEKKIAFVDANNVNISTKRAKRVEPDIAVASLNTEKIPEKTLENSSDEKEIIEGNEKNSLMINRTIRSGEVVEHEFDVTVFGRINNGAKIITQANVKVFGIIEGEIEAHGDYILLQKIGVSGHVLLHNEKIDASQCTSALTLVRYTEKGLVYKAI